MFWVTKDEKEVVPKGTNYNFLCTNDKREVVPSQGLLEYQIYNFLPDILDTLSKHNTLVHFVIFLGQTY